MCTCHPDYHDLGTHKPQRAVDAGEALLPAGQSPRRAPSDVARGVVVPTPATPRIFADLTARQWVVLVAAFVVVWGGALIFGFYVARS